VSIGSLWWFGYWLCDFLGCSGDSLSEKRKFRSRFIESEREEREREFSVRFVGLWRWQIR